MKKNKILINVEPIYLEDHSDPSEDSYLWAYKVKIKNNGADTIKLLPFFGSRKYSNEPNAAGGNRQLLSLLPGLLHLFLRQ